jgi:formylglycine-generating enzyme required for sulfatase activity
VQQVYGKDGGEQRPNEIKNFSGDLISLAMVSRANSAGPGNTLKSGPGQTPDWGLGISKGTAPASPLSADPLIGRPRQERIDGTLGMKFVWCRPGTIAQDENESGPSHVTTNNTAELAREYEKAKSELQSASARHRAGQITSQDYARYRLNLETAEKRYNSARTAPQLPTQTVRDVTHKGFWIGVYEVKQSEWLKLMKTKPWLGKANARDEADLPVTYVNWHDAVEFCKKLTIAERQAGGISLNWRYSLPSEAQWEYACRATTSTPFSFGRELSSLENFGWFKENAMAVGEDYPHTVGQKRKNHWGLYDMHGNVAEWCTDLYVPTGAAGGSTNGADANQRVVRGGSFHSPAAECRSSYHYGGPARVAGPLVGFRVVLAPRMDAPPQNSGTRKRAD